jgi:hypothetical protein
VRDVNKVLAQSGCERTPPLYGWLSGFTPLDDAVWRCLASTIPPSRGQAVRPRLPKTDECMVCKIAVKEKDLIYLQQKPLRPAQDCPAGAKANLRGAAKQWRRAWMGSGQGT